MVLGSVENSFIDCNDVVEGSSPSTSRKLASVAQLVEHVKKAVFDFSPNFVAGWRRGILPGSCPGVTSSNLVPANERLCSIQFHRNVVFQKS